ncbi:MAG: phosphoglycolate phosphatase [Acidobacteria bacterium]|nr:MAG: phosphoglycolate phosphatase [Acidobacteriota bacterium]
MGIPSEVLRQIRLLIFDLDGTLADTKQDLALSVNAMRASLSLAPLAEEVISSYVGRGVTVLVSKALGDSFMPAEMSRAQEFFLDYYRQHMLDHTVLYPAVRPVLERLRDRQLSVLTNKPSGFSRAMLAGLGIATYFSWVYGGDSFETKKPDPVGVFRLMEEAGVPARETLVVGDSDTDVLAGRNAGAWTCGVTYGFGAASLETSPPDLLLSDLGELPPILEGS